MHILGFMILASGQFLRQILDENQDLKKDIQTQELNDRKNIVCCRYNEKLRVDLWFIGSLLWEIAHAMPKGNVLCENGQMEKARWVKKGLKIRFL